MGCRSCGRVMHSSLGSTVAFHHERHENTGEAKGRHHPRGKCQAGKRASDAVSPAAVRLAVTEA
jgi:hypothetical protein